MILCLLCLLEVKIISLLLVEKKAQNFSLQMEMHFSKVKRQFTKSPIETISLSVCHPKVQCLHFDSKGKFKNHFSSDISDAYF